MNMKFLALAGLLGTFALNPLSASAASFEVTITNITRGQQFTPIIVVSHRPGLKLFELGDPASAELATLAEEGNTQPLADALRYHPRVLDIANSTGLLDPGDSVTVRVRTRGDFDHVSLASMLIPTNDAFFALNGVAGPHGHGVRTLTSVAYDAGSEANDELCASIPGPFFAECGGPGGGAAPAGGEEGYVHVHAGIHGIGNLSAPLRDWRNPVARITIRRVP
ncbi:MAG: hypothetical protein FJ143_16775 [Deltaproteobacteria bacterium]|nr:hypothetical protein [Deltaproteobacteria bacterium]MBM4299393.1 hypothetical protein [Deltaproteobacteria bacterium]